MNYVCRRQLQREDFLSNPPNYSQRLFFKYLNLAGLQSVIRNIRDYEAGLHEVTLS